MIRYDMIWNYMILYVKIRKNIIRLRLIWIIWLIIYKEIKDLW